MLPFILYVISLLTVIGAAFLFCLMRERDFGKVTAAYARLLDKSDQQNAAILDRWYLKQNLPPGEVDLKSEHEDNRQRAQEKAVERRNGGALPHRVGPVDSAVLAMERDVRRKQTSPASA